MQEKAGCHHPLAAQQVGGDGDAKPRYRADNAHRRRRAAGNGAGNQQCRVAGGQAFPLRLQRGNDGLRQKDDDDAVAGAAPVVNANQIPEGRRLANLAQEHFGALFGALPGSGGAAGGGRTVIAQLPQSHILRAVVENPGQRQQDDAADDAGDPKGHSDAQNVGAAEIEGQPCGQIGAVAHAEPSYQPQHYGQRHYGAKPLGRLQQPHPDAQMPAEPGGYGHGQRHLENAH